MIRTRFFALPVAAAMALAFMGGCAMDQLSNIPADATITSSGNEHLSYMAPSGGRIWVYDVTNDRIDYSGPVSMNDSIVVDPHDRSVTINGRTVNDKVSAGAQHRIYFVSGQ
ncbi:MAG TPA: hypothetical protein VHX86_03335 [Tepidisphaeraceae bacterium]|nr:hypothetical protein [Tepidisphaeraceae bacterium]